MRRKIADSPKTEFWRRHIKAWLKGKFSQADYCHQHGLNVSAFSKWKNKLYPKNKGLRNVVRTKNRYFRNAKLSDTQVENLMLFFLLDRPFKEAAESLKISGKTVSAYYQKLGWKLIDGALCYPQLFFGTGKLLMLGPPPNLKKLAAYYRAQHGGFPNNHQEAMRVCWCKSLVFYSYCTWNIEEIKYYEVQGLWAYFARIHAPKHQLEPSKWDLGTLFRVRDETSLNTIVRSVWEYAFARQNGEPIFSDENWKAMYQTKVENPSPGRWLKTMCHDLKWVMQNNRIKRRSSYWDIEQVNDTQFWDINDSVHQYLK